MAGTAADVDAHAGLEARSRRSGSVIGSSSAACRSGARARSSERFGPRPPPALRGPLLLELGRAQLAVHIDARATPLLAQAVAAIDPPERARAALLAGRSLGLVGRFEQAAAILESGLPGRPVETDIELLIEAERSATLGCSRRVSPLRSSALHGSGQTTLRPESLAT